MGDRELVGESPAPECTGLDEDMEPLEIEVIGEVSLRTELNGRLLCQGCINAATVPQTLSLEVPPTVYIYVQLVDEDTNLEFVFVCGHLRDMPEDDTRPFVGSVNWSGGSASLWKLEPLELGATGCLEALQSLVLKPHLSKGRRYEAVQWEDTSDEDCHICQFQRCLI